MKTNQTFEEREENPSKILSVRQGDGLWTVYEDGDEIPVDRSIVESITVTARQLRLALLDVGLLGHVETLVGSYPELKIWFGSSAEFHNRHPLVLSSCFALGLSAEEKDEIFKLALTKP